MRMTFLRGSFQALVVFVLAALLLIPGNALAKDKKNILILNSYHQGYKWTDDETIGIIKAFEPVKDSVKIHVEYMGTKWVPKTQAYLESLRAIYRQKFSSIPMSVIIATDDDAFNFLLTYRDEIFGKVPVVFCGVNWFKKESIKGKSLYTGVSEDVDFEGTIDLMLLLHPDTKRIFVIMDDTTTGRIIHGKLLELVPKYSNRIILHALNSVTMQEIVQTVSNAPPDSLVLMTIFQKDAAGELFEYSESTNIVSKVSHVPVYGFWDFNLGEGIVGGLLTSGYEQGRNAGAMALRISKGESPAAIPVLMKSPNRYMFDFRQMERFGINSSDLPEGSILTNKPMGFKDFYTQNKLFVLGTTSVSLSLIAFIFLISMIKLKRANALVKMSEQRYRTIFENTGTAMGLFRNDNILMLANSELEKLTGYEKSELENKLSWHDLTGEKDLPLLNNRHAVQENKVSSPGFECHIMNKAAEKRNVFAISEFIPGTDILLVSLMDITERNNAGREREKLIGELQTALSQIKTLRGIVPICANCKQIRDDKGYWSQVEKYVSEHSEAKFSHGICPTCMEKLYPEFAEKINRKPEEE